MSAISGTWWHLVCDGVNGKPCGDDYIDDDTEVKILDQDPAKLREWASGSRWLRYAGTDVCPNCTVELQLGPHLFMPGHVNAPFCRICDQWATEGQHVDTVEVPGQLEIPVQVEGQ